ncbi:MAG TPA: polysaccharide pyruvyl transferase family protein [Rhodocyclaceae bacterium]
MNVLFGAFDRHNLGDVLLAHMAAASCGEPPVFAGLAARDLVSWSGPAVVPLDSLSGPMHLTHVGGELLDCDADQAAFMLGEAAPRWRRRAPYVVARDALPAGSQTEFRAVGGVGLGEREPAFRDEVIGALRQARAVSVRDKFTQALLGDAGVEARLEPDPVTRIAEVFGPRIRSRQAARGPYLAVQFAAECGDDASLAAIARGLERIGLPVVLFRAGAAPWHDALEPYERLASRLPVHSEVFRSLDVWDICALIAGSRGFVGTSLHGRIVAEAFGLPAISLERGEGTGRKLRAYLATWRPDQAVVAPGRFADTAGLAG